MQTTESLILEYGRTKQNTKEARRCRARIRSRSRNGDYLARQFLGHDFTIPLSKFGERSIKNIRRVLTNWLTFQKRQ